MDSIMLKLLKMKAELDTPFAAEVGPSEHGNQFAALTNFFRPGPSRKVIVFHCDGVDFSYDDDAEKDDDINLAHANKTIYYDICSQAETVFGKPLGAFPADRDSVMRSAYFDEDVDEPGVSIDDVRWTPEYDGGALFDDATGPMRYWMFNNRYLFLQCGEHRGDNNMACFVAMTLTPSLGENAGAAVGH